MESLTLVNQLILYSDSEKRQLNPWSVFSERKIGGYTEKWIKVKFEFETWNCCVRHFESESLKNPLWDSYNYYDVFQQLFYNMYEYFKPCGSAISSLETYFVIHFRSVSENIYKNLI